MSKSFGQHKADGHSDGPLGHGGHHRMGGHGTPMGNHKMNPHTIGSNAGHTMMDQHGGDFPQGITGGM